MARSDSVIIKKRSRWCLSLSFQIKKYLPHHNRTARAVAKMNDGSWDRDDDDDGPRRRHRHHESALETAGRYAGDAAGAYATFNAAEGIIGGVVSLSIFGTLTILCAVLINRNSRTASARAVRACDSSNSQLLTGDMMYGYTGDPDDAPPMPGNCLGTQTFNCSPTVSFTNPYTGKRQCQVVALSNTQNFPSAIGQSVTVRVSKDGKVTDDLMPDVVKWILVGIFGLMALGSISGIAWSAFVLSQKKGTRKAIGTGEIGMQVVGAIASR